MRRALSPFVAIALFATPASAQSGAPSGPPAVFGGPQSSQSFTPEAEPAFTPPAPPRDTSDAHSDRVVLMPTAYTHPAGTFYASDYDILLVQAGYAVTDSTQVTLSGIPPVGSVVPLDLTLKSAIAREGPVRFAAYGSATGIAGLDQPTGFVGRAGATAQFCFDETCRSSASMAATMLLAGPATMVLTGVGAIWRVHDTVALLAEVDTIVPLSIEVGKVHGMLASGGLRFAHRTWSLDACLARAIDPNEPTAIPLLVFTYRFLR